MTLVRTEKTGYFLLALGLCLNLSLYAQQALRNESQPITTVPRLVRVSNTFHAANGLPLAPLESVTFSVYSEETGGTPLWQETQNVNVDAEGHYNALLGSTLNDGVPLDLFSSSEPRWLGAQFNRPGEIEQPRVRLASVPYALKASDAETLGGLPATAYLRASGAGSTEATGTGSTTVESSVSGARQAKPRVVTGTANLNSVAKFTDGTGDIGDSIITDSGSAVAVAGQAAVGSGHAPQTYGFDLYVNGSNPTALIDAYGNPGTASLWLQGRSTTASNHQLSVNGSGLFSITPGKTGTPAFSIFQNGNLTMGTLNPWAGAKLQVHTGTNQNLAIGGPLSSTTGVTFHSFNDAITANEGFEFRGSPILFSVGNVGIGNPSPAFKLDVAGTINGNNPSAPGVQGNTNNPSGPAVWGSNNASSSGGGAGVGGATNQPGNYGVAGYNNATTGGGGAGVTGSANAAGNAGVNGFNNATSGYAVGVQGATNSTNGAGVSGNSNKAGVFGVVGFNSATSGYAIGTEGASSSPGGVGVWAVDMACSPGSCTLVPGTAAQLQTAANGTLLEGLSGAAGANTGTATQVFRVDGTGQGYFGNGVQGVTNAVVPAGNPGVGGIATATSGVAVGAAGVSASPQGSGIGGLSATCNNNSCTVINGTAGSFYAAKNGYLLQGYAGAPGNDFLTGTSEAFYVDGNGNGWFKGQLAVASSDVIVANPGSGIILKSPDGTKCARISLDNTGALATTIVTCP